MWICGYINGTAETASEVVPVRSAEGKILSRCLIFRPGVNVVAYADDAGIVRASASSTDFWSTRSNLTLKGHPAVFTVTSMQWRGTARSQWSAVMTASRISSSRRRSISGSTDPPFRC